MFILFLDGGYILSSVLIDFDVVLEWLCRRPCKKYDFCNDHF